jgi:hypothetical protein
VRAPLEEELRRRDLDWTDHQGLIAERIGVLGDGVDIEGTRQRGTGPFDDRWWIAPADKVARDSFRFPFGSIIRSADGRRSKLSLCR